MTVDHTLVQRLVDAGALSPKDVSDHPQRAVVTRAVGLGREVAVDIAVADIEDGDTLLLCSDGLTSVVGDDAIADILEADRGRGRLPMPWSSGRWPGAGPDHITVIVVHIDQS